MQPYLSTTKENKINRQRSACSHSIVSGRCCGRPIFQILTEMKLLIPILFLFAGCAPDQVAAPSCDFIEAIRTGSKVSIKIYSDSPRVAMCRDLPTRTECLNLAPSQYDCIRIEANVGDVVRFETETENCEIIIQ